MTQPTTQPMTRSAQLLLADDDQSILETMRLLFEEEGYRVMAVASVEEALAAVASETFACIVSDCFGGLNDYERTVGRLRDAARPTPVGICSAWRLSPEALTQEGFAFFVGKPFTIEELLATVAACIDQPLTVEQQEQATVLRRFLACLSTGDWDGAAAECSEDVVYVAPEGDDSTGMMGTLSTTGTTGTPGTTIEGREAYRAYIEQTAHRYPGFRAADVHILPMPNGLAARYTARWRPPGPGPGPRAISAGLVCQFTRDAHIRQLGIRLDAEHLRTLQNTAP